MTTTRPRAPTLLQLRCRNPNSATYGGNGNLCALWTVANKLGTVQLRKSNVKSRIQDLSADKICQRIQNSSWCGNFALLRSLPLELIEVSGLLTVAIAFLRYVVKIFLYSTQTASISQNSAKLHLPLQIGRHTWQENSAVYSHSRAGIAQSVE
jgi:hypothetical protein